MAIAELKQALCDENLPFAEKYVRLRLMAPQLSAEEVEELSLALKRYSDTRRNALKPDPHTGVLTFLLGKHAQHNRNVAFGYAHRECITSGVKGCLDVQHPHILPRCSETPHVLMTLDLYTPLPLLT